MSLIEINEFSYTYPGEQKPALRDVDLYIDKGDFVILAGPSGSGKSTLGKALAGFLFQDEDPDYSGSIFVNSEDMCSIPLFNASKRVAYVQQNPEDQFCTLTVKDEIAFGLENACMDPDNIDLRIEEVLKVVQGTTLRDCSLATLSGGEKQKIAIASMLALAPDVLILDEPTSNLDPEATHHIFKTLYEIRHQKDLTVVVIEHKLNQLRAFDAKLILIEEGRITQQRKLSTFKQAPIEPKAFTSFSTQGLRSERSDPVLEVENLTVDLNEKVVLSDVNFTIYPGEFVAVMGPNGSGKTTLLQTIMGFNKVSSGKIHFRGEEKLKIKTSDLIPFTGYIFQNPDHQLFTQSVWDEAILTMQNLHQMSKSNEKRALDLLNQLGLDSRINNHPQRLSYGEKRRLNLGAAILHQPKLLLIDEILIGQDRSNAEYAMQTLSSLAAEGCAILLVNHHADLTNAYCDRIIFIDSGRILIDNSTANAFSDIAEHGWACYLPQEEEVFADA